MLGKGRHVYIHICMISILCACIRGLYVYTCLPPVSYTVNVVILKSQVATPFSVATPLPYHRHAGPLIYSTYVTSVIIDMIMAMDNCQTTVYLVYL